MTHSTQRRMLTPAVRRVLKGTPIAHLATVLPDGSPHSVPLWIDALAGHVIFLTGPNSRKARNLRRDPRLAISIATAEDPFTPVCIRGEVVDWIEGEAAWELVDRISTKYVGAPYPRDHARVIAVVEPVRQTVGAA